MLWIVGISLLASVVFWCACVLGGREDDLQENLWVLRDRVDIPGGETVDCPPPTKATFLGDTLQPGLELHPTSAATPDAAYGRVG
jgi:hypothetical protein